MSDIQPVDFSKIAQELFVLVYHIEHPLRQNDGQITEEIAELNYQRLLRRFERVRAILPDDAELAGCGPVERDELRRLSDCLNDIEKLCITSNSDQTPPVMVNQPHVDALHASLDGIHKIVPLDVNMTTPFELLCTFRKECATELKTATNDVELGNLIDAQARSRRGLLAENPVGSAFDEINSSLTALEQLRKYGDVHEPGELVREAWSVVRRLYLPDIPPEPTGTDKMSINDAIAHLDELRCKLGDHWLSPVRRPTSVQKESVETNISALGSQDYSQASKSLFSDKEPVKTTATHPLSVQPEEDNPLSGLVFPLDTEKWMGLSDEQRQLFTSDLSPADLTKEYKYSWDSLKLRISSGEIRAVKFTIRRYRIVKSDLSTR